MYGADDLTHSYTYDGHIRAHQSCLLPIYSYNYMYVHTHSLTDAYTPIYTILHTLTVLYIFFLGLGLIGSRHFHIFYELQTAQ